LNHSRPQPRRAPRWAEPSPRRCVRTPPRAVADALALSLVRRPLLRLCRRMVAKPPWHQSARSPLRYIRVPPTS